MSHILAILMLLSLPGCGFLLSPPAIAIEEEVAIEALKEVESLIEKEEAK